MFLNNDFSEQPKIHTVGVLPVRRPAEYSRELKSNDPALRAMTDFTSKFAITVAPDRQIDSALTDMKRLGVRAMLVVRAESVIGLITSYDIERQLDGKCLFSESRPSVFGDSAEFPHGRERES
jgi:predicted transcriptional regulator